MPVQRIKNATQYCSETQEAHSQTNGLDQFVWNEKSGFLRRVFDRFYLERTNWTASLCT